MAVIQTFGEPAESVGTDLSQPVSDNKKSEEYQKSLMANLPEAVKPEQEQTSRKQAADAGAELM